MQEKLAGYFALLLYAAGTVGLVWLCVRFILPWAAPFITAYLLAALLEKPVGSPGMAGDGARRQRCAYC